MELQAPYIALSVVGRHNDPFGQGIAGYFHVGLRVGCGHQFVQRLIKRLIKDD